MNHPSNTGDHDATTTSWMHRLLLAAIVGMGAIVRYGVSLSGHPFYNSDTAIVDLMARHFLHGEFCFYYWGAKYYGILDPVLLMPLFKIFGQTVSVSGILPFSAGIVFLLLMHTYLRKDYGIWIAHGTTLLLAVPSTTFLGCTFTTYNYSFGACFGVLHLVLAQGLRMDRPKRWFWLGLAAGFSYYYFRIVQIFWMGLFVHWWMLHRASRDVAHFKLSVQNLSWRSIWHYLVHANDHFLNPHLKRLVILVNFVAAVILVFSIPLWLHGKVEHRVGFYTVKISFWHTFELGIILVVLSTIATYWRQILVTLKAAFRQAHLRRLGQGFLLGYLPGILGYFFMQVPSSPGKIVDFPVTVANVKLFFSQIVPSMVDAPSTRPLAAFTAIVLWISLLYLVGRVAKFFYASVRCSGSDFVSSLVVVGFVSLLMGLFGIDLTDVGGIRYFLPLMMAIPLGTIGCITAVAKHSRVIAFALLGCLVVNNGLADYRLASSAAGIDYYELVARRLIDQGYTAGYADYWIAYRMTAISHESLVLAPTENNDRYAPYLKQAQSQKKTFLLSNTPLASSGIMTIKGRHYQIVAQEVINGMTVDYLEVL